MVIRIAERVTKPPALETFADLLRELGDIPLERIRLQPAPGTASEADVVAASEAPQKRLCELVDGVLVEKPMGTKESLLALFLGHLMWDFLEENDLGILLGADGMLRIKLGLVRIPDLSFISWDRLPGGKLPDEAIAGIVPDLVVEVLSQGNTRREMERKLKEYFQCGVRLVWLLDPKTQTAKEYTSPAKVRRIGKDQNLDGGDVLPGFRVPLKKLFAAMARRRKGR
jgi:Uma2 family endonuclease